MPQRLVIVILMICMETMATINLDLIIEGITPRMISSNITGEVGICLMDTPTGVVESMRDVPLDTPTKAPGVWSTLVRGRGDGEMADKELETIVRGEERDREWVNLWC